MKTEVKKRDDFKAQPLKGVYANAEELGRDMNRYLLETLLESTYNEIRNKDDQ